MVRKWSELRERLPAVNEAVSELLDTPPVRALTDRWNRSVVAAGVRSFVEELKADLERRRVEGHFPSVTELAARAARHVARLQQPSLRPAINATGQLLGPPWTGRPLADDGLQQMVAFGHSYVLSPSGSGDRASSAAATLCRFTGAEAATVVPSYAGAIWIALTTLAPQRDVLVARGDVAEVDPGVSLADLIASAGAKLREVGAVNRASATDYESAVTDETAAIVRHVPETHRMVGATQAAELEQLAAIARERELVLVDMIGNSPLVEGLPGVDSSWPSAVASLSAGATLVVVRGDGLVGGPGCGVLLGSGSVIRDIVRHPMFSAWRADALTLAALEATLDQYDDRQRLELTLPIFQLLSTSIENLRHRAERLAPQMAEAADITRAEAVPTESQIGNIAGRSFLLPSHGVALVSDDVESLDTRLRSESRPIVGRRDGDRLLLDLRSVFPRDDRWLATCVGGEMAAIREDSSQAIGGA